MKMRNSIVCGIGAGALLLGTGAGLASEITWDGSDSTTFNAGGNWVNGTAPANDSTNTGDVAVLPGTLTTHQPALTADQGLNGLRFDGSGWTLGGTGFTLSIAGNGQPGGTGIVTTNATGTNTIDANVAISSKDSAAIGFDVATGGTLAINGNLSRISLGGGGAIVKTGGGNLDLYGGGSINLTVSQGTVRAMGSTASLNSGSILDLGSGSTFDVYGVNVTVKNLQMVAGSTLTGSSDTIRTITTNPYNTQTLSGLISGNLAITYNGTTKIATANNSYAGKTTIKGTLSVANLADGGQVSAIGQSSSDAANLSLSGGLLQYTGGAVTTDRGYTLSNNNGGFEANGTGALVITGSMVAGQNAFNSATLRLRGSNTDANTLVGAITDGTSSRTVGLAKSGAGTWVLTGANSYTKGTTISGGTLLINNTTDSGTGTGAVSVSAGTLGGTGSISGNVSIGDGTDTDDSVLSPGSLTSAISNFSVGGLTFGSDGVLSAQLDSDAVASDQVTATGSVALGDGLALLQLSDLGTGVVAPNTTFTLLASDSGISGYFRDLQPIGGVGPQVTVGSNTYQLNYLANAVTLTAVPEPSVVGLLGLAGLAFGRRRRRMN
jgi:autotransporter-associated beta strand protein